MLSPQSGNDKGIPLRGVTKVTLNQRMQLPIAIAHGLGAGDLSLLTFTLRFEMLHSNRSVRATGARAIPHVRNC